MMSEHRASFLSQSHRALRPPGELNPDRPARQRGSLRLLDPGDDVEIRSYSSSARAGSAHAGSAPAGAGALPLPTES